jgi:hypothetical protein
MTDTTPSALAVQVDIHRRMSGIERLRLACEMSDAARELALTRLRLAHPDWSRRQLWLGAGMIVVAIYVVITRQRDPASRAAEGVTAAH